MNIYFNKTLFASLLFAGLIITACKMKKDEIPTVSAPFCPTIKAYFGDQEDSLMFEYTLTISENPREDIFVMNEDIDLAESDTRKAKFIYYNNYFVYSVYDANGNEIGKADTTWGTRNKPTYSVEYIEDNSEYDTLVSTYTYTGNLLSSITSQYNSNPPSTTLFYYDGEDCIRKVHGSSSGVGFSDTSTVEYTYTNIEFDKDLLKNKYGYVFFQFGNYGTKLLSSAVETNKSYCPWGSCGTNTNSEYYEYTFEGNTLHQKLIRPGITLYQRYEPICD